jgi:hypothetical protein
MLCGVAKDLTKLGGKTVTKLITGEEKQTRLFKLVSLITGFKNSLKGAGYFLGAHSRPGRGEGAARGAARGGGQPWQPWRRACCSCWPGRWSRSRGAAGGWGAGLVRGAGRPSCAAHGSGQPALAPPCASRRPAAGQPG